MSLSKDMEELCIGFMTVALGCFSFWFNKRFPSNSPYKAFGLHWGEIKGYAVTIIGIPTGLYMIFDAIYKLLFK